MLFLFHVCLYYAALSVPYSLVITSWERADLLALLCVMFSCVLVTFPYGVLGQMWYLIVSIPDIPYFHEILGFTGPPNTTTYIRNAVRTAQLKLNNVYTSETSLNQAQVWPVFLEKFKNTIP